MQPHPLPHTRKATTMANQRGSFMSYEFADRLIELRRTKGMSQEELASALGISRQAVSKWERAESAPDIGNLVALAGLYDVSLDELVRGRAELEEEAAEETERELDAAHSESDADAADDGADDAAANETPAEDAAAPRSTAAEAAPGESAAEVTADPAPSADAAADPAEASGGQAHAAAAPAEGQAAQEAPSAAPSATYQQTYGAPSGAAACAAARPATPQAAPAAQPSAPAPEPAPEAAPAHRTSRAWQIFPYPLLCVVVYLFLGFFMGLWHPGWIIFLTIPFYYWVVGIILRDPNYIAEHGGRK